MHSKAPTGRRQGAASRLRCAASCRRKHRETLRALVGSGLPLPGLARVLSARGGPDQRRQGASKQPSAGLWAASKQSTASARCELTVSTRIAAAPLPASASACSRPDGAARPRRTAGRGCGRTNLAHGISLSALACSRSRLGSRTSVADSRRGAETAPLLALDDRTASVVISRAVPRPPTWSAPSVQSVQAGCARRMPARQDIDFDNANLLLSSADQPRLRGARRRYRFGGVQTKLQSGPTRAPRRALREPSRTRLLSSLCRSACRPASLPRQQPALRPPQLASHMPLSPRGVTAPPSAPPARGRPAGSSRCRCPS